MLSHTSMQRVVGRILLRGATYSLQLDYSYICFSEESDNFRIGKSVYAERGMSRRQVPSAATAHHLIPCHLHPVRLDRAFAVSAEQ